VPTLVRLSGSPSVVVLAGGTGGAKLARGMADILSPEKLTVVANTGDDVEIYGAHVSPDPDLVSFWLADVIDERGWGLADDTFAVMDGLRELGEEIWFNLGDRDLAIGLKRAELLAQGERLTDAHRRVVQHLNCKGTVLPASDQPVRTRVQADGVVHTLQEFLIRARGQGEIEDVQFRGAREAGTTDEILAALATADVIVIGPSNPVLSIGPMLAIPQLADALSAAQAPVVAVSPLVGGRILKGPTAACMRWAGVESTSQGLVQMYERLIDGIICEEDVTGIPQLMINVLLDTPVARREVAQRTLTFAKTLAK
jgi:LPPG:FO 2-phospho-L-lactate transferase